MEEQNKYTDLTKFIRANETTIKRLRAIKRKKDKPMARIVEELVEQAHATIVG